MTRQCLGECKRPHTRDFTPEVTVHPVFGWVFALHDTYNCPDRIKWRMNDIMSRAIKLRDSGSN